MNTENMASTASKMCPLSQRPCLGKQCRLWAAMWKPHRFPDLYYQYEGCTLAHTIPWTLKEKQPKPPAEAKPTKISEAKPSTIPEDRFSTLQWEDAQSVSLGNYQIAYTQHNIPDKWNHAFNILKANNALIASPFHEPDYQHRYWIYPHKYMDRIFRKKLW